MWLVRNVKTNRSNVINANNILFTRFVSSQIFCDDRSPWVFFCRNNVMCQLLYDIIYHPIPAILNIWEDVGDWQPCIDDPLVLTCVGFSICKWQMSIIIWLSSEAGRYNASASCDVDASCFCWPPTTCCISFFNIICLMVLDSQLGFYNFNFNYAQDFQKSPSSYLKQRSASQRLISAHLVGLPPKKLSCS